ncbi:short-chain dehydrogenase [Prosthecochloris sp. GSB1]|uniref:SDR family NAD(P)-dependent oxidoreductase n=1 Tax=Prosthecochloris sp. GSB1 TaxID=281093 RepID=UPI000B8CAE74|nr:SDR family oxidoreductase [Prosthecochloris sp. GSB1]ASQ89759.1 short-chain dehydrogenase [Prosthecochloris sp. GSB1]
MSCTLITGASSGIGKEFAREFARRGNDLVLVARSIEALRELAGELRGGGREIHVRAEDLSEPEGPGRIYEFCRENGIRIDLLVNCAGFGFAGRYDAMPPAVLQEMVQVNAASLAMMVRLFLPGMISRNAGGVINVSSLSGFQGVALIGLYSATKSFIITLTESLREELAGTKVKATVVCPGYVRTAFHERAGQEPGQSLLPISDARLVVRSAIRGLQKNRLLVFPTALDALLVFLQRILPRRFVLKTAALMAPLGNRDEVLRR